jgi:hypothetical protein
MNMKNKYIRGKYLARRAKRRSARTAGRTQTPFEIAY